MLYKWHQISFISTSDQNIDLYDCDTSSEGYQFCNSFQTIGNKVPLVVVPSTYAHFTEDYLQELGVNIVIYANHLLRSAYPSMVNTAETILDNSRSLEASEKNCMSIKDIISLIPEVN